MSMSRRDWQYFNGNVPFECHRGGVIAYAFHNMPTKYSTELLNTHIQASSSHDETLHETHILVSVRETFGLQRAYTWNNQEVLQQLYLQKRKDNIFPTVLSHVTNQNSIVKVKQYVLTFILDFSVHSWLQQVHLLHGKYFPFASPYFPIYAQLRFQATLYPIYFFLLFPSSFVVSKIFSFPMSLSSLTFLSLVFSSSFLILVRISDWIK